MNKFPDYILKLQEQRKLLAHVARNVIDATTSKIIEHQQPQLSKFNKNLKKAIDILF